MSGAVGQEDRLQEIFAALTANIPYVGFLGVDFERWGDEVTGRLAYSDHLIGNPMIPALHGGATGAFLEITAIMALAWTRVLECLAERGEVEAALTSSNLPPYPKPIDISIDYLRSGKPRDVYARARILRRGRRVANVQVEAWQDERARPIASAHGHFLLPERRG